MTHHWYQGRSSLLKGYVFYLIPVDLSIEPANPSTLTEEDVRWMIFFCGGTVLNQRCCDNCLNTEECQLARRLDYFFFNFFCADHLVCISENKLMILDLTNPSKTKKRKLDEESPGLISLSPAVEICGICGTEFVSDHCYLRQQNLSGVTQTPLLWLINVICAHKLLRAND
jgi:hypothetical protein